jgi:hypothetical protein
MIAWLALPPWLRTTLIALVATAGLGALAGLGFWRGMVAIDAMELRAAETAKEKQDAKWQAQIAASNATVANARAEQAVAALAAEGKLRATEQAFETELKELRERNAALPGGDGGGISHDRVRLLNQARRR